MFWWDLLLMEVFFPLLLLHLPNVSNALKLQGLPFPATHVKGLCKRIFLEQILPFADSLRKKCASTYPLCGNVSPGSPGHQGIPGYFWQEVSVVGEKYRPTLQIQV